MTEAAKPRVALLVTCLVDFMRPSVGFAAAELLERAGCEVHVPAQTCCGQPAYNHGDQAVAEDLARRNIAAFEGFDYVVAPSGSCAGMFSHHYPRLFATDAPMAARARALAERTFELTRFLTEIRPVTIDARFTATATYHDSCSGLRELGIHDQPRALLQQVEGLSLVEMNAPSTCCGFGGTFCVKYPDISARMVVDKAKDVADSGAEVLLGGDLGCLMNIAGRLSREGRKLRVYHVAEVLAGAAATIPPLIPGD